MSYRKILPLLIILFLFISDNLFSQWIPQNSGTSTELTAVKFVSSSRGFIIGHNYVINRYIWRSTFNGGTSWDSLLFASGDVANNIFFLNFTTGWIAGNLTSPSEAPICKIWRTTTDGLSWSSYTLADTGTLRSVFFIDASTGYAVGYRAPNSTIAVRSTNGGVTWTQLTGIPSDITSARDVYFINANTGWIVGTKGAPESRYPSILRTTNGGNTWANSDLTGYIYTFLSFLKFFDTNTGYAGGSRDTTLTTGPQPRLFKTTNGGSSWTFITLPYTISPNIQFINGMYFQNSNTGWTVGNHGAICYTSNGGTNWNYQPSGVGTTINLTDVHFSSGNGWVVGANGTIIKTTNGGVTFINPVSNEIPNQFSLSQNYPNPFNPMTKLQFKMPNAAFVKIIVFDILGREIETLVNEQLQPGTYKVDWNATNFPSGVYYYKLSARDYTETKKMILIK